MEPESEPMRIGILGCGAVGRPLLKMLLREEQSVAVKFVVVRDPSHEKHQWLRDTGISLVSGEQFDKDFAAVVSPVDTVVELIGESKNAAGVDPYELTRNRIDLLLRAGKNVVTANKTVISRWGRELIETAREYSAVLALEAAVCGSIPIIRLMRDHWRGQRIRKLVGILNGTCNFILTVMPKFLAQNEDVRRSHQEQFQNPAMAWAFEQALQNGFAEAPSDDVRDVSTDTENADLSGRDAAEKLAILAGMTFGVDVDCQRDMLLSPILNVTPADIEFCEEMGYTIKQLAVAELVDGQLRMSVQPTLVPNYHPLANVSNEYNAIYIEGEVVENDPVDAGHFGSQLYYGKGAGEATATAAFADVMDIRAAIARNIRVEDARDITVLPSGEHDFVGYIRSACKDIPGVFKRKAAVLFGETDDEQISVEQIINLPTLRSEHNELVPDMILIDWTKYRLIQRAMSQFQTEEVEDRVSGRSTKLSETPPLFLPIAASLEDKSKSRRAYSATSPQGFPFTKAGSSSGK